MLYDSAQCKFTIDIDIDIDIYNAEPITRYDIEKSAQKRLAIQCVINQELKVNSFIVQGMCVADVSLQTVPRCWSGICAIRMFNYIVALTM